MADLGRPAWDRPAVATITGGALGAVSADDDHLRQQVQPGPYESDGS